MKAVIIAGGFGTRLRPLTYTMPKPVIPIAGAPLLMRQFELLNRAGINDFVLCVNYLSDKLEEVIEKEKKKKDKVVYCVEEKTLGTAGAVKNASRFFDSDPMVVMNGDILTDVDLKAAIKFHKEKKAKATIVLVRVEDPTSYGLVLTERSGRVAKFIEKPSPEMIVANTINAGIYIIEPDIFDMVPQDKEHSFERQLFPALLDRREGVYGFKSKAFWIDVGNPSKYIHANRAILQEELKFRVPGKKDGNGAWIEGRISKDEDVKIYGPSFIGEGTSFGERSKLYSMSVLGKKVKIGRNSSISSSIIMDGTVIGEDVEIKDSIIGPKSTIEDDVYIHGGIVLAEGSFVRKGSKLGIRL